MNFQAALSALKSASTLEAASAAYRACLAAPDLEEAADWAAHKYAQKREALEAQARHEALEAESARLMAHKRERIAALESELPTVARDLRIRILRAELAVDEASRASSEAADLALKVDDWTAALALESVASAAILELRRAKWARRAYRMKTGGRGPLGAMTREDHLMRYPG